MEPLSIKYKAVSTITGKELAKKAEKMSLKGWTLQHIVVRNDWFYGFFVRYSQYDPEIS